MARDTRTSQIQTKQLVITGSNALIIYPIDKQDTSNPNQGIVDSSKFPTGSIGQDVLFYVSGARGGKGGASRVISTFGGDVHVSGNISIDGDILGGPVVIGSLLAFGITDYATTNNTASNPETVGQLSFDPQEYTGPVRLRTILAATTGSVTASVRLLNVTSGSFVEIGGAGTTTIGSTNEIPTIVESVNLRDAQNFAIDSAIYELQLSISTGSQTAFVGGAEFRLTGSVTAPPTRLSLGSYTISVATSSNPETVGGGYFIPSEHNTRSCELRATVAVTTALNTAFVQLYNITSGALVHLSGGGVTELSSSSTTPTTLQSVNLFNATNFSTGAAIYEIRTYGSGSESPTIIFTNSEMVCS